MQKKLKKIKKIEKYSIGLNNAKEVSAIFDCSLSMVYRALSGGTSPACQKVREYVEENYNPQLITVQL